MFEFKRSGAINYAKMTYNSASNFSMCTGTSALASNLTCPPHGAVRDGSGGVGMGSYINETSEWPLERIVSMVVPVFFGIIGLIGLMGNALVIIGK